MPEPQPPVVTVTDPTRPAGPVVAVVSAPRRPWSPRAKRLTSIVTAFVLLTLTALLFLRNHRQVEVSAEARGVHLRLGSAVALSPAEGVPGAEVQTVQLSIDVANASAFGVGFVSNQVDGGTRALELPSRVAPGRSRRLLVQWPVRCAEIGAVRGPQTLLVNVRGPRAEHVVTLSLLPLVELFHTTATDLCAVLLPGGTG